MIESETIERDLFVDFYSALPERVRREHGVVVERVGPAHCVSFPGYSPPAIFNRALGLGVEQPATEAALDAVIGFMSALRQPYAVPVGPRHRPADLAEWLERRGFARGYAWMKFERDVTPYEASTELRVALVDSDSAQDFAEVVMQGFHWSGALGKWLAALPGRPGWSCFAAWDGDRAVGAATLFTRGETAELGFAATMPEARGRGAQSALLAARIRRAAELGARRLIVETGVQAPGKPSNSYRNILRAGFREAYVRDNWLAPAGG